MPQEKYTNFINDITFQTCLLFNVNDPDIIENFRDALENGVLEDIIRCKDEIKPSVTCFKHSGGQTSGFLKSALVASGISKDGVLPFGYNYKVKPIVNDKEMSCYAINRYKQIEDEFYQDNYKRLSILFAEQCLMNDRVDIEETLKSFFYLNDRTSCLMFDTDAFVIREAINLSWDVQKQQLRKEKLEKSLFYRICEEVRNTHKHFSYNERNALTALALADYHLYLDGYLSEGEIEKISNLVEAAREEDNELLTKFEDDFNTMINKDCKSLRYKKKD
jgi:hypothetical protein